MLPENEVVMARLLDVEEGEWTDQKTGELVLNYRWKFIMENVGPDFDGQEISGMTSRNYTAHPNCKAYLWVTQLLGTVPDTEVGLDTDTLQGKPCRLLIGHRKDQVGRVWMKVKEVLPPRGVAITMPEPTPF